MSREVAGRRRLVVALFTIAVVLVAAVVPGQIHLNRQRARLASVLSAELGRQVTLGTISLRLLPKPGFDIANGFSVAEDPAFGVEPMLSAEQVSADLRLSSLWSGRIEIAQIKFSGASLNLVRRADHHWNLESLVLRAAQIPSAPTGKRHAEARPRFPYIEATDSRINFKFVNEKSAYTLMDADFSGWLEADDKWNLRLEAHPMRTDLPISDAGSLTINARAGRAPQLGDMPIEAIVNLQQAQLGEFTKLVLGHDLAWRGTIDTAVTANGPLKHLQLAATVHISEFRRYNVMSDTAVELRAECSAVLNSKPGLRSLDAIACNAPLGSGAVALYGSTSVKAGAVSFQLTAQAHRVPAEQLVRFYRNAKQDVASDLSASGELNGQVMLATSADAQPAFSGDAELTDFALSSSTLTQKIVASEPIRFTSARQKAPPGKRGVSAPAQPTGIRLLPISLLHLGTAAGDFTPAGWQLQLQSDLDIPYALSIARTLGFGLVFSVKQGHAAGPLSMSGAWTGFQSSDQSSDLALTGVVAGTADRELHISSARLRISPAAAQLANIRGSVPAGAIDFDGDLSVARPCIIAADCQYTADLHSPVIDVAKLRPLFATDSGILGSIFDRGSWLDRNQKLLASLNASGSLRIDHLVSSTFAADDIASAFRLRDGALTLQNASATGYGGRLNSGTVRAELTPAHTYAFSAQLENVNLAKVASALGSSGVSGTLSATLTMKMAGDTAQTIANSAVGRAHFAVLNGSIATIDDSFHFKRLLGDSTIADRQLTLQNATAAGAKGKPWSTAGTISFSRQVQLTFTRAGEQPQQLAGRLAPAPVVSVAVQRASK